MGCTGEPPFIILGADYFLIVSLSWWKNFFGGFFILTYITIIKNSHLVSNGTNEFEPLNLYREIIGTVKNSK